jgi:photosystem II stability/assembly factor-like uncharacterized protein
MNRLIYPTMKPIFCFLFFVTVFTSNTFAQYNWQTLTNAPTSWRFDDFYFLNPQLGWAVSPSYTYLTPNKAGQIWKTMDGGNTWKILVDSSQTFYRSVGFTDANTGWVGNLADSSITHDTIPFYHTSDGGVTWSPVNNLPNPKPKGICGISIVTDSIIYAYGRYYGPAVLIKSVDKGNSWTSQSLGSIASGLIDAHFFNKDTGFVTASSLAKKAMILSTFNGGLSWQIRYQSTHTDSNGVWKIVFPSRTIGYASVEYWGSNYSSHSNFFLKTTDGGITWSEKPFVSTYDEEGIGFINDSVGWIGGDFNNRTYKTTDGGNTWNRDYGFGTVTPPYAYPGTASFSINRFRKFGDTLMYASGNTLYKLQKGWTSGIFTLTDEKREMNVYPDPFSNETSITYSLPIASHKIQLTIYNLIGEIVCSQDIGIAPAGINHYSLQTNLPSGLYYCCISSEKSRSIKKVVVAR